MPKIPCALGKCLHPRIQSDKKEVLKAINPNLLDLADEDDRFQGEGSSLFGGGFKKRMEGAESVKLQ